MLFRLFLMSKYRIGNIFMGMLKFKEILGIFDIPDIFLCKQ